MDLKLLGAEVRRERKALGYTQESFAEFLDLDKNVICNLEQGCKLPNRDNLFKIVKTLKISLDKHLEIEETFKDDKIARILEKYNDLPLKKKTAVEEIILASIDSISRLD